MTRLGTGPKRKYAGLSCPNRQCDNVSAPIYAIEEEIICFLKEWLQDEKIIFEGIERKQESKDIQIITEQIISCKAG